MVQRVKVDLSELCKHLKPRDEAVALLKHILRFYRGADIVALLELDPDIGLVEVYVAGEAECGELCDEIYELADTIQDYDEFISKVAERVGADPVVELDNGYDLAVAFLELPEPEE